jgi:membrane protein
VLSFGLVLGTGLLLLVLLVISAALAALGRFFTPAALPGGVWLWQALHALVSLAFVTLLFGLIYKVYPNAGIAWRDVWVGAFVSALLFTTGKVLLGVYLGRSSTTSTFGAASSLVVVLLWVYYSAQILLFGAEFTRAYAGRRGPPVIPADNADLVTPQGRARQGRADAHTSDVAGTAERHGPK